jgi:flagellar motor switch protein FliM
LLSPLVDLLLGGSGDSQDEARDLTDIDEELIRSVTELISVQMERTWKPCNVSVSIGASVRAATAGQSFAAEERLISVGFEIALGAMRARMRIFLPISFCHALVRSSHLESARRNEEEMAGTQRLRERMLDCIMTVSAELGNAQITVGEMMDLRPGSILNLRTSVKTPVRLGIGDYALFEMTPVRRGVHKTAQLGRRCQPLLQSQR